MSTAPTDISIRKAVLADNVQLASLAGEIFYETFEGTMPHDDLELYIKDAFNVRQVSKEISDEHNTFLLAYYGDHILGYAKLSTSRPPAEFSSERVIELERLYLLKKHHGKKTGSLLMDHALNLARAGSYKWIWLAVWEKNPNAIKFYADRGFTVFGSQTFMRGKDAQIGLLMKKELTGG